MGHFTGISFLTENIFDETMLLRFCILSTFPHVVVNVMCKVFM